jgi:DNA-binding IclR family transcriptional regulator
MKPTDRALSIFEAFELAERPLTLSELAEAAGLPVSTCHGIVGTLMERGYLYVSSRRKSLYPTRRLVDMVTRISRHDPYLDRLEPRLETLRESTQETVIVGRRQHDHLIYLLVLEGPQTIRYSASAGSLKPLHSTAIGKALLSTLSDEELTAWLDGHKMRSVTAHTLTRSADLLRDVRAGHATGYFATYGESVSDVMAIAVPVAIGGEWLGVAVAGPLHRMKQAIDLDVKHLLRAKRLIEADRG